MEKTTLASRLPAPALPLAVVFALALALRYPVADMPLERDEGEYAYIAQRWLAGEVPYKESFDQKPPGAFLAYALFLRALGPSPAAIHWGAQLYTLGTLTLLYFLGRKLFSARVAAVAAALCAFTTADACVLGSAANTETFLILPLVAGGLTTWLAVESGSLRWGLVTGLLGGAALLCKQVALFNVFLWLAWVLWQSPRRWALAAVMLAGLSVPLLLAVCYFRAAGALAEFYDGTIGYNLSYASRVPLSDYPAGLRQAMGSLLRSFWPVYLLAAASLVLAAGSPAAPQGFRRSAVLFTALWLGATFVAAATGGQFFPHYFITTLPPLCLLAAVGLLSVTDRLRPAPVRAAAPPLAVAAVVLYGVFVSPWYYLSRDDLAKCRRRYGIDNPFAESLAVSEFVAAETRPDDTIFVAGSEPQIYYYARRKSACSYIYVYPLLTPFPGARERQRAALDELRRNAPAVIVTVPTPTSLRLFPGTPPDFLDGVDELLAEDYEVAAVLPFRHGVHWPLLTGDEAARYYHEHPIRFGTMPRDPTQRTASVVVWRRRLTAVAETPCAPGSRPGAS